MDHATKWLLHFIKAIMYDRIVLRKRLCGLLIGRNIVSGTLHLRSHSIVVLLPSGGNRWRLLREKRSVKTPQEAIFADEEAKALSRGKRNLFSERFLALTNNQLYYME